MRFRHIRDILDWTRTFHETLADHYDQLAEGHERERVGLLLHYLAHHERLLSEALEHYEEKDTRKLLETAFEPDLNLPPDHQTLADTLEQVDTAGVLSLALRFHDQLITLYQGLAAKAPSQEIKALFDDIASHETREKLRAVRDTDHLEDL